MSPDKRRQANLLHECVGAAGAMIGTGIGFALGCPAALYIVLGILMAVGVIALAFKWDVDVNA